jgi:zinc protease
MAPETRPRPSLAPRTCAVGAVVLAFACAGTGLPQGVDSSGTPVPLAARELRCPSGLRVVVQRVPRTRVVSVAMLVGAGGGDDPADREGLAHLVEHLALRSTRAAGAALDLDALGVSENAETRFDATVYHAVGVGPTLPRMLAVMGRRLVSPLAGVDRSAFDVERGVVRNELRERTETGFGGQQIAWLQASLFPSDHPCRRPVGGTHASLSALSLDGAQKWAAEHYAPEATTLVITGDVDLAGADALLRASLPAAAYGDPMAARAGRQPVGSMPTAAPEPPAGPSLTHERLAIAGPEIVIGWSTPGGYARDARLLELWTTMVANVFVAARLEDRDVAGVSFEALPSARGAILVCRLRLIEGKHAEETLNHLLAELPWGDDDSLFWQRFEPARKAAVRDLNFDREHPVARAVALAERTHFLDDIGDETAAATAWRAITPDEAHAFARRYLTRGRARAIIVQPSAASARPSAAAEPDVVTPAAEAPDPSAATIASLAGLRLLDDTESETLPNGLTIVIVPRGLAPVVSVELGFRGGAAAVSAGLTMAGMTGMKVIVDELPAERGIDLRHWYDGTLIGIGARADAAALDGALAAVAFSAHSYDVEWPIWTVQSLTLPLLRRNEATADFDTEKTLMRELLPGRLGILQATADQIERLTKAQVAGWLHATIGPRNAVLVIAGAVDPPHARAAARRAFADWTSDAIASSGVPPASPKLGPGSPPPTLVAPIVARRDATQVELTGACVLPPADLARQAAYDVAARVIADRLTEDLRVERGATYGVRAGVTRVEGGTTFLRFYAAVATAKLVPAITALGNFLGIHGPRPPLASIARSQARLVSDQLAELESSPAVTSRLLREWETGWPPTAVDGYPARVSAVGVADVDAILRNCGANLKLVLTGDAPAIRDVLQRPPAKTSATSTAAE